VKHPNFRLIAAPFTPMHEDGSLNLARVADQTKHLVATGVRGAFVGGTTGEGQSLGVDERCALAEAWVGDSLRSKLELIIHVGHNSLPEAVRMAAHAQKIGADKIAMHAPVWFKQQTLEGLIEFSAAVAAAAPSLPFYLYDIPSITGIQLSSAVFLKQAKGRIPTLAGLKFTNPDCVTAQECIQLNGGEYDILWGIDEMLIVGVALGASGAVGSTYNFAAPLYLRMLAAVDAGDQKTARIEQARSVAMVRVLTQFTPLAALKYAMNLAGVDCGPPRLPVSDLSADEKKRLHDALASGKYFEIPR
jgi:N-acetylneuraminate lyase